MKKRNSKFEILRIIAMILIIMHHISVHGFRMQYFCSYSYNSIIIDIFSLGGQLGVNLFILISAYFCLDSEMKFKRLLKIICETFFYSIIILIIFKTCLSSVIKIDNIKPFIFPVSYSTYWFITDYVLLMLFSPYLNIFINSIDKEKYKKLLIILITLSVFIEGVFFYVFGEMALSLTWFITLYLIVGYIKKYINLNNKSYKLNLIIGIIAYSLLILLAIVINILVR